MSRLKSWWFKGFLDASVVISIEMIFIAEKLTGEINVSWIVVFVLSLLFTVPRCVSWSARG